MAGYSEGKDLIQNVKDLAAYVQTLKEAYEQVEPSMEEIISIKAELEAVGDKTIAIIDEYQSTLDNKTDEMNNLLENCKAQFQQITNDVETLVNMGINFDEIKDTVQALMSVLEYLSTLVIGYQWMGIDEDHPWVPMSERLPSSFYLLYLGEEVNKYANPNPDDPVTLDINPESTEGDTTETVEPITTETDTQDNESVEQETIEPVE